MTGFALGQAVRWKSAKGGAVHQGVIVAIVPAKESPAAHVPASPGWVLHFQPDSLRREPSYLVALGGSGAIGRQLYRPPAWRLEALPDAASGAAAEKDVVWQSVGAIVSIIAIVIAVVVGRAS